MRACILDSLAFNVTVPFNAFHTIYGLISAHAPLHILYALMIISQTSEAISLLLHIHGVDENQCGPWSAGFIRSQLIRIYTVFKRGYWIMCTVCLLVIWYLNSSTLVSPGINSSENQGKKWPLADATVGEFGPSKYINRLYVFLIKRKFSCFIPLITMD